MKLIYVNFLVVVALIFSGCSGVIEDTTIKVLDEKRHYYPIVQGQDLTIVYELQNTGESDFRIDEIQTSCGCVIANDYSTIVPVGKSSFLSFVYDSKKNIGLVEHFIYIYGNLKEEKALEVSFDVHVVPGALYTKDYEELYHEEVESHGGLEEMVEGKENEKRYYIDK